MNQAITLVSKRVEGGHMPHARVECSCGAIGTVPVGHGSHNPEFSAKKFRELGWEVDVHHARVRCPTCLAARKARAKGGEVVPMKHAPQVMNTEEFEIRVTAQKPKETEVPKPQVPAEPRRPTADDRMRIRRGLDEFFDDSKGMYTDGLTDQLLGERLGLPWAWVRDLRETAYGPILSDHKLEELKSEIGILRAQMLSEIAGVQSAWNEKIEALSKRIDARLAELAKAA